MPSPRLRQRKFGCLVVGDVEIEPAVVVGVESQHAEPGSLLRADPGARGDVLERAVAAIAVQTVGDRRVRRGPAVVGRAARHAADLVDLEAEVEVVGDEEVEPAVAVVVQEDADTLQRGIADAALGGDVGEVPSPWLRQSWFGPKLARYRSTRPSWSKSPVAAPMP